MVRNAERGADARDPWRDAPVGELHDPLLPRWFVVTALVTIPVAVFVFVAAFVLSGTEEVPVAERRPPPSGPWTNAVGDVVVDDAAPVVYDDACPMLAGVRVAGTDDDRARLRRGLATLCNTPVDADIRVSLEAFAQAGGVVRYAVFEATGVDSTATARGVEGQDDDAPTVVLNSRFAQTAPLWTAPVVAHDAVLLGTDPAAAESALAARRAEHAVCQALRTHAPPSHACADAAALLALENPLAALRAAGYR